MRKITDIYEEYKIMPNLQMHQLRVAAVAKRIYESMNTEVDQSSIIMGALLHDMGNVIKFDLSQTKSIFGSSDKEVEDMRKIKTEFIDKYGESEHLATLEILKELHVPITVENIVKNNDFQYLCTTLEAGSIERKIMKYADLRVGPQGILSYDERMSEANARYKNHKSSMEEDKWQTLANCGKEIETQIFANSNIKPEDINDESVAEIIEELKNFEI